MTAIRQAVDEYIKLRRGLGYQLYHEESRLIQFASFLEQQESVCITQDLALQWACQPTEAKPIIWAQRLSAVRGFTRYYRTVDPKTEIPAQRLLPVTPSRAKPYLYDDETICRLLDAARSMPYCHSSAALRCWTYYCFFGLLAVTGMRVGEVRSLKLEDVDLKAAKITVKAAKNDRTRLVLLHETTRQVLADYIARRQRHWRGRKVSDYLFVSSSGAALQHQHVLQTFHKLSRQIGLRNDKGDNAPRLHQLRHTFATKVLLRWHRNGQDPERMLPVLSTCLGHVSINDTYWYLQSNPALMKQAMKRLESCREDRL